MKSNYFQNGAHLSDGLGAFGMGAKPTAAMLESVQKKEPEQQKPVELTMEQAQVMILEAVAASVKSDGLTDAAQAVFDWADGSDNTYDALDGFAQALAGIGGDDDDADPTDDQLNAYYEALGNMANFFVTLGADDDTIAALFDDEDDDIAASLAAEIKGLDADDRAELVSAYSLSGDDSMTEALKKVVRQGKVVMIKKPFKKRRLSAAQRMALKKASAKSHTAQAKLHRAKSMKLRAKRIGR
ncbi:hypothetical protein [Pantoea sp. CCBC3-3-1]|uniref:hypothetical protein n=1 Tax=Pantoea sp. CCBC3-3-1 TaxID=2490851 RepID=UPI0011BF119B|nr:hypothetical protein [Pantoea sp. CCBC3-3-1]